MCNLENDVKAHVQSKIAKGETFTCFNVTQELGAARHRYIKPIVHQMFEDGEMGGTVTRSVDKTIAGEPFVYSVVVPVKAAPVNPLVAVGGMIAAARSFAAVINTQAVAPNRFSPTPSNPFKSSVDEASTNEGGTRLRIRKGTLDKAQLATGKTVYASYTPGSKQIFVSTSPNKVVNQPGMKFVTAEVDNKNNLRINLAKLGVKGNTFKATAGAGVIVVDVA